LSPGHDEVVMTAEVVVTGDAAGTVYAPGEVAWSGDRLVYVGPPRGRTGGRRIAVGDGAILPGLVNTHNHAGMALLRGYADDARLMAWLRDHIWPVEARMTAEDVYVGTLLACLEMIRGGTVAFADMYLHADAVARAADAAGLRAFVARGLVGDGPEAEAALAQAVEEARGFAARYPLVEGWLGPHAPYTCSPALLERVAEQARLHGLGIHIHLSESVEEMQEVRTRYGLSPIALAQRTGILGERTLVAHGVHLDAEDIRLLANSRATVAHCPVSNLKLGNGTAPVLDLLAAGVNVALGSDGPASTNTLDLFLEMRVAAWLQKTLRGDPAAFGARQALALATRGGARGLGYAGGVLEPGAPADLIAVRWSCPHTTPHTDPFSTVVYATQASDVRYTVVAGRLLLDDGRVTVVDEAAVLAEARERAGRLTGRP
jgi:5-methylthioadenosine/S-adenosylhomocysteine deaminase